jgi:hypothetical protein
MLHYPKALASSQDPTKLSLTVESITKALIGFGATFLVAKGVDAVGVYAQIASAQTQIQAIWDIVQSIVALGVQAAPLVYALWHSMNALWGIVRKCLALTRKVPTDPQS